MTDREKELFKTCLSIVLDDNSNEISVKDAKMYLEILKDRI